MSNLVALTQKKELLSKIRIVGEYDVVQVYLEYVITVYNVRLLQIWRGNDNRMTL